MKQILISLVFLTVFASCNNNKNAGAATNMDSTSVNTAVPDNTTVADPATSHATGTTGTGTVADSGNAAHPGSDTSHINMRK